MTRDHSFTETICQGYRQLGAEAGEEAKGGERRHSVKTGGAPPPPPPDPPKREIRQPSEEEVTLFDGRSWRYDSACGSIVEVVSYPERRCFPITPSGPSETHPSPLLLPSPLQSRQCLVFRVAHLRGAGDDLPRHRGSNPRIATRAKLTGFRSCPLFLFPFKYMRGRER